MQAITPPPLEKHMPSPPTDLAELLRTAIAQSDESLHAIAQRADVDYGNLYKFVHRERQQVTLAVASRLFDALGIAVKRVRTPRRRSKADR